MSKLMYVIFSFFGAVGILGGAVMIASSIEGENLYWLVFGLAVVLLGSLDFKESRGAIARRTELVLRR